VHADTPWDPEGYKVDSAMQAAAVVGVLCHEIVRQLLFEDDIAI
jgi:hypothetical protein